MTEIRPQDHPPYAAIPSEFCYRAREHNASLNSGFEPDNLRLGPGFMGEIRAQCYLGSEVSAVTRLESCGSYEDAMVGMSGHGAGPGDMGVAASLRANSTRYVHCPGGIASQPRLGEHTR